MFYTSHTIRLILTYLVEIKRKLAGYRAVQPGLEIRRPILREYIFTASVSLADSRHAGVHTFAAIYVFDRGLAEKEEHVAADVVRAYEIGLWKDRRNAHITLSFLIHLLKVIYFDLRFFDMRFFFCWTTILLGRKMFNGIFPRAYTPVYNLAVNIYLILSSASK